MQDAQLSLLPQRLRKKQSQRDYFGNRQDPLQSSSASTSARRQSQNVWRPAGCHSVHTTGVGGVHSFSRPASPCRTCKSCSTEASQTYDKENEVTNTRSSRIFKQTKGTHPGQLLSQRPAHINIHQGILHLPDPLEAPGSRTSRSPSLCRPALSTISNDYLNRAGNINILQPTQRHNPTPTPHTAVYSLSQQSHQRTPHSHSSSCRQSSCNRRLSCGSSSSCSGYTPGTRGTHQVEYTSPLHEGLRLHRQQQCQSQLSPSSQHPASPYLHALVKEIEQQHGQAFTNGRDISPLGSTGRVSQQQANTPVAASAKNLIIQTCSQQHPRRSPSREHAGSPVPLPNDAMAEEPVETYYSPELPHLHQHFKQPYHLTPCYVDLEEYDAVQQEDSSSSRRQMQESVPLSWEVSRLTLQPGSSQLLQRVSELLKPAAIALPCSSRLDTSSQDQLAAPEEVCRQQSDLALGVQQQSGGQQLLGQEKSMRDAVHAAPCDQDIDRSPYRPEPKCPWHEHMDTGGRAILDPAKVTCNKIVSLDASHWQQHQRPADEAHSYPIPQEDLELQQRRQQWRAHQQLHQHQRWLSQLELQEHQQRSSHAAVSHGKLHHERQQHPQEPPVVASPAEAAAASAIADYKSIIGKAQAMAQKSEAAWAQLNKYHQHRVCGRLPGGSSASGWTRSCTPTSGAGNRQLSRLARPSANATATGNPAAAAGPVAIRPRPCKTLGSCLLQISSPAAYHTPTGEFSGSSNNNSIRNKPPTQQPAFLCYSASPAAAAAAAAAKYRELPSLPGSPAAAAKQDSNSSYAGGGRTLSMARQLNIEPAWATAAIVQSQRVSSEALRAATRASIAANLRSSCGETPDTMLPVLPDCSAFATQSTGIRARDQCVSSSDSVVTPGAGGRRGSISEMCSPLPCSPAWSVYLTPGAAEAAAGAAAAAVTTRAVTGCDLLMARSAGLMNGDDLADKDAWWRTPEDQMSQQQLIQQQQQGIGSYSQQYHGAAVAAPVEGLSPPTVVRPRVLLDCFDGVQQLAAAPLDLAAAVSGARSVPAAPAAADVDMQGSSDALPSSRCSNIEGFPFTPGSACRLTFYGNNSNIKKQHSVQLASHTARNAPLAVISPAVAASTAFEPAMQPAAPGQSHGSSGAGFGATWLCKYPDAKSAAVVTPDSSVGSVRSASLTCQGECASIFSPLDVEGMTTSASAADGEGLLGHDGAIHDQKECWTVHNNWVATGMDAVGDSIDVTAARIALCSITDAVNVPTSRTACLSSGDHLAATPATKPNPASSVHTPMQSSSCNNLQQQESSSKPCGSQPTSSDVVSIAIASVPAANSEVHTDNLHKLSPLLDNLTPAQALAAYTELAYKLKQRLDETAHGLLARLNLSTPAPSCGTSARSSVDSMGEDDPQIARGTIGVSEEFQASVPAAVVCKQAVGMVVLSPHTACGRWQSSRTVAE